MTEPTVDIRELEFDEIMATVAALGLFNCCELGLPNGDGPPPMRNCEVRFEYISGVGAVPMLGGVCMGYALKGPPAAAAAP